VHKDIVLLGIDYGGRYVGIAILGAQNFTPKPLTTIINDQDLLENLQKIINQHDITDVVVGLPRNLEGKTTNQTKLTEQFIKQLKHKISASIHTQDETLTSEIARNKLKKLPLNKQKELIHETSAQIILEDYVKSS